MTKLNLNSDKLKTLSKVFFAIAVVSIIVLTVLAYSSDMKLTYLRKLPIMFGVIGFALYKKAKNKKDEESVKEESPS